MKDLLSAAKAVITETEKYWAANGEAYEAANLPEGNAYWDAFAKLKAIVELAEAEASDK